MKYDIEQSIVILRNTPPALRAMLDGLSDEWIHNNYGKHTFSPFDIVGHLIHGERTDWIPRARIILEHGVTRAFDPFDRYAMYEDSKGKSINELLNTFENLRMNNLDALMAFDLTEAQLDLPGSHPELGRVTLRNLLATWTVHDLNHIAQLAKALAFQYRDQVGPWLEYASILRPPSAK